MPLEKVLDDCLIVYAQNGEMLRPENGYPLRLLVPGWEGNVCVKWLRRIKVGDQPWHFRSETARYTDPMPDGKWRQFSFEMECKSVITRPSGGMKLDGRACYEIQGFAWSGNGTIRAVDVTVDGGAELAGGDARRAGARQVPDALPLPLELERRAGDDREPRGRQHRLRAADGAGPHEGARDRRLRAAPQRHPAVVGQRRTGR